MKPHKIKGDKTEAIILAELIKKGYNVSIPFGENQRYDLIIDMNGVLERIQCKTGRVENGYVRFNTSSSTHNKRTNYKNQIEAFIVYCFELDKLYYIPIDKATVSDMRLRFIKPKHHGGMNTINWASEYEF